MGSRGSGLFCELQHVLDNFLLRLLSSCCPLWLPLCVALVYEQLFNAVRLSVRLSLLSSDRGVVVPVVVVVLGVLVVARLAFVLVPVIPVKCSRLVCPFCVAHLFVFILSLIIAAPSCFHLAPSPSHCSPPLCNYKCLLGK